jgi:hypothetical protein
LPGSTHDRRPDLEHPRRAARHRADRLGRQGLPRIRRDRRTRAHTVQGPQQTRVPERSQPRPRAATWPRRTRLRPTQDLAHPPQTPLLPPPSRPTDQVIHVLQNYEVTAG